MDTDPFISKAFLDWIALLDSLILPTSSISNLEETLLKAFPRLQQAKLGIDDPTVTLKEVLIQKVQPSARYLAFELICTYVRLDGKPVKKEDIELHSDLSHLIDSSRIAGVFHLKGDIGIKTTNVRIALEKIPQLKEIVDIAVKDYIAQKNYHEELYRKIENQFKSCDVLKELHSNAVPLKNEMEQFAQGLENAEATTRIKASLEEIYSKIVAQKNRISEVIGNAQHNPYKTSLENACSALRIKVTGLMPLLPDAIR